ncbi:MAG: hypothetical protein QOC66_3661 [Pseudonocardiales bacterium]|nr:hypothetical protein [Pseudonocardiales bacterium]
MLIAADAGRTSAMPSSRRRLVGLHVSPTAEPAQPAIKRREPVTRCSLVIDLSACADTDSCARSIELTISARRSCPYSDVAARRAMNCKLSPRHAASPSSDHRADRGQPNATLTASGLVPSAMATLRTRVTGDSTQARQRAVSSPNRCAASPAELALAGW